MAADDLRYLRAGKEAAAGGQRQKAVLGTEEGVIIAQALALGLNKGGIAGIIFGDFFPGIAEMALDAVLLFKLKIKLLGLLKKSAIVPGSAVMDGGGIGGAEAMGRNSLEYLSWLISCDSSTSSSRSAVWPTTLELSSADRNTWRAAPSLKI